MVSRAHRRIALNAMGVGLGVVLLASGAFAGVRSLGRSGPEPIDRSSHPPTRPVPSGSSPVQPTPSASATTACTSTQVRAVASLGAAAGSREGDIAITNLSNEVCTLRGTPTITLLDRNLNPITTGVSFSPSPSAWEANGSPKPPGWPVVTLRPGGHASFRVRWGNWCATGGAEPVWRASLPGGGTVTVGGFKALMVPPCNSGPGGTSTIEVGPFEPRAGP
jgi:hypothetical protein